jgi:hypothetical protein
LGGLKLPLEKKIGFWVNAVADIAMNMMHTAVWSSGVFMVLM